MLHLKSEPYVEPYIVSYMSRSERSLLAQIRVGVLPLRIETGRYGNLKCEERTCKLCNQEIEDETHFVCSCQTFEDLRKQLLPRATETRLYTNGNLLVFWMNNYWRKTAQFISNACVIRRQMPYT